MKKGLLISAGVILGLVVGFFAAAWLAGNLYFLLNKAMPHKIAFDTWGIYWHYYSGVAEQKKRLLIAVIVAGVVVFGLPALIIGNIRSHQRRSLHGDARFASPSEVRKAGLFAKSGIIVGKYRGQYLIFGGQQFVLLAAPTRSGKGVAVVIPNLLNFGGSVVVLDIKLENFRLTSRFRESHGQKVFLFNPFAEDFKTHRWNPLDGVSRDRNFRIGDIQAIGQAVYPSESRDGFWNDQARNLFLGLVLYVMETPELPGTLGEVLRQSSGKGQGLKDYLTGIIKARETSACPLSNDCIDALNRFCSASDNTGASILATFNAPLTIFANPIVDAATAHSDFDITNVRSDLMSIYIGIQPSRLADASLLINLLFSQLVNLNTKELPQDNKALKHQCLLILDEFTAIGKIAIIAKANAFIAGYNLRLLTIVQSVAQLESVYGEKDTRTLVTNHALQVIYPPREQKDANAYSEMLGYYTESAISKGRNHQHGGGHGSESENRSDQRRALMLPQELKEMSADEQIILLEKTKPIQSGKARYFDDAVFMDRLKGVSGALHDLKGRMPSQAELERIAFVREDLSSLVPMLDLDLHTARTEKRSRLARPGEAIDLGKLAIDQKDLPKLDNPDKPSDASLNTFVDAYQSKLGWADPDTGAPVELAAVLMAQFDDVMPGEAEEGPKKPVARRKSGSREAKTPRASIEQTTPAVGA